ERIASMTQEGKDNLLVQICKKHPNMVFEVVNCSSTIQDQEDFDLVVLDEVVLLVAQMYRQDVLAIEEDNDYNRGKRPAAYRQFILWTYLVLGIDVSFQAVVYGV
ncbi:hypothetical protein CHS0354_022267, partial [Potamilus streckersoni]